MMKTGTEVNSKQTQYSSKKTTQRRKVNRVKDKKRKGSPVLSTRQQPSASTDQTSVVKTPKRKKETRHGENNHFVTYTSNASPNTKKRIKENLERNHLNVRPLSVDESAKIFISPNKSLYRVTRSHLTYSATDSNQTTPSKATDHRSNLNQHTNSSVIRQLNFDEQDDKRLGDTASESTPILDTAPSPSANGGKNENDAKPSTPSAKKTLTIIIGIRVGEKATKAEIDAIKERLLAIKRPTWTQQFGTSDQPYVIKGSDSKFVEQSRLKAVTQNRLMGRRALDDFDNFKKNLSDEEKSRLDAKLAYLPPKMQWLHMLAYSLIQKHVNPQQPANLVSGTERANINMRNYESLIRKWLNHPSIERVEVHASADVYQPQRQSNKTITQKAASANAKVGSGLLIRLGLFTDKRTVKTQLEFDPLTHVKDERAERRAFEVTVNAALNL